MKTLLVTGAAGGVAAQIRPFLRERYALRLFDRVATPPGPNEVAIVGDLCDPIAVRTACEGVDGIIHLACAYSLDISFEDTLDANYRGLLYLLDACREFKIPRFVFASSHHVLGQHRTEQFSGDDAAIAPDGFYALSKAFGEAACALYARKYLIRTLSIRIGNAGTTVLDGRRLRLWIGASDMAQLIRIGLEHPDIQADIVYGVSRCPEALFQNTRAAALGYVPQEDATANLDKDFTSTRDMPTSDGPYFVGGPYVPKPLIVTNRS